MPNVATQSVATDEERRHQLLTAAWPDLPRRLTEQEVAIIARCSARNVRRWRSMGLIRATKPAGGRPLYDRESVRRFLEEDDAAA
jgi:hypothetical protein